MERREKQPKKNHEGQRDRLSDLPDGILLHILSFLPRTKQCVQTSVLSKRWKCLWASLPVLIFDRYYSRSNASFMKFVRRVLSERENVALTKFSFNYRGVDKTIVTKIPRIINYAGTHNVQHFSLCLKSASLTLLLPLFDICRSLKTLELQYFEQLHLLKDFTLPCLTTLNLSDCSFWDKDQPTSLDPFVGLCNLKCLQLDSCQMGSIRNFKINGPQLDSLSIREPSAEIEDFKVEIVAPQLRFLCFKDKYRVRFSNLDCPLLEIADIDVSACYKKGAHKRAAIKKSLVYMISLFRWLSHVQSLVLTIENIQGLRVFTDVLEDQASPFVRLKTLKVKYGIYIGCSSGIFDIPNNVIKYFGKAVTVEKIRGW